MGLVLRHTSTKTCSEGFLRIFVRSEVCKNSLMTSSKKRVVCISGYLQSWMDHKHREELLDCHPGLNDEDVTALSHLSELVHLSHPHKSSGRPSYAPKDSFLGLQRFVPEIRRKGLCFLLAGKGRGWLEFRSNIDENPKQWPPQLPLQHLLKSCMIRSPMDTK